MTLQGKESRQRMKCCNIMQHLILYMRQNKEILGYQQLALPCCEINNGYETKNFCKERVATLVSGPSFSECWLSQDFVLLI